VSFLFAVEADNVVVCHALLLLAYGRDSLHKAHHCLITVRIKLVVVASLQTCECLNEFLLRVFRDVTLYAILEVGEEAEAVFKLNFEGLIIDWRPSSTHLLIKALLSVFTELSLNLVFVHELDLPDVLLVELKGMVLPNYLKSRSTTSIKIKTYLFGILCVHTSSTSKRFTYDGSAFTWKCQTP
jgi:hypothetical protein